MTANGDIVVHCENLTKMYSGEIAALKGLTLDIRRGHVFGYIGHNGAGKTTTIRILAGLLLPSSGTAVVGGVDVLKDRTALRSVVGYMPDDFGVYDQMRVWEYLDFFGAAFRIPRKKRRERLEYVLDITDANYMRDRFVDTLSKGMKQRCGIARTLMHDPQVLLLDEPANGLDPQARIQMRHLLRRLADGGKTLLVSSHILPELAAVCDTVGVIHKGELRAAGPIQKVLAELQRDRSMEIKVASGYDAALAILKADANCKDIDEREKTAGVVNFRFQGDDDLQAALLKKLVAGSASVVSLREVPLSLEDAYMAISGLGDEEDQEKQAKEEAAQAQAATAQAGAKGGKSRKAAKA